MADQELLIVVRMRDEASAVLRRWTETQGDGAKAVETTTTKVTAFREATLAAAMGAKGLGHSMGGLKGRLTSLGDSLLTKTKALRLMAEAGKLVVDVYKQMVDNTIAYEKSQKALGASLDVTGGAIGLSKDQINDIVLARSSTSRIDDTNVRSAAAELIRVGRVSKETFEGALGMSARLAEVMGTDLVSASRLVAGAMADPVKGMGQLREAGIQLNDLERERIKLMELSSGRAEAQAEALRLLTERLGKGGGAGGQGLAGAFEELGYAWNGFLDQFNDSWLSDLSAKVVSLTADVVNFFTVFKTKSAEAKVDARKEFLVALERELEIANKQSHKTSGDQKYIKSLEQQIGTIRYELQRLEQDAAAAVGKGLASAVEKAANRSSNTLAAMGKALDLGGVIIDKKVAENEAKIRGAREDVKTLEAEYQKVRELSEQGQATKAELDVAFSRLRVANEALKLVVETAQTTSKIIKSLPKGNGVTNGVGYDVPSDSSDEEGSSGGRRGGGYGRRSGTRPRKGRNHESGSVSDSGVTTFKPLRDELATIAALLKSVGEGSYAIRKAEMEAKASRAGRAEADLLRQTFSGREEIASKTAIDNLEKETALLRQLAAAVGDVNRQNQIRRDFENARKLLDVSPADRERLAQAQRDKDAADKQKQEAETAYKTEQDKIDKATAFARETFKGFFSDLKDGLKKGQGLWEAFGNAARNALNKITEKIVDLVSNKLMDQLFEGLGNVLGSGSGKGSGASGGGDGGIFGFVGKGLKALATFLPFADGGIMTSRGPVPLRRYAGGGIATSPQLAMFGEGSVPEAYVPVPSGRIPVELRGGGMRGGMTVQTNISVNMAAPADGQGSGGRGGNMMEQARELGAIVTAMVNKNLQDQMRPGGLLNPSGSFSAGVVQ